MVGLILESVQHVRLFNLLAYENVTDLPERTPVLGRVLGFGIMVVVIWIFWRIRPSRVDRWFRRLQLVSAALYSLGHGTNDAQKTMGIRPTKLRLVGSFYAETAGAVMRVGTVIAGIPVSTTHAITNTISGVGVTSRFSAVRWGVARQIVWAWILSIPLSAVIAAASFAPDQTLPTFLGLPWHGPNAHDLALSMVCSDNPRKNC